MKTVELNVETLNKEIVENKEQYILSCENYYKTQIKEIVNHIALNKTTKFILLAGPSSSGKTTTSFLLMHELNNSGFEAKTISLDDFFVEREETPLWENGKPNYESVDAIDWKLFDKCINSLISNGKALMPTYNFVSGAKEYIKTMTLEENDIIIIEGLHALNPIIDKFINIRLSTKIYIAPTLELKHNGKMIMDGINLRFFRRLIRDIYTRGSNPERTLNEWESVRLGEKLYIDPFKDSANFNINSVHPYELCIYKSILKFLGIDKLEKYKELLKPFDYIQEIDKENMPKDSLLQEFVH